MTESDREGHRVKRMSEHDERPDNMARDPGGPLRIEAPLLSRLIEQSESPFGGVASHVRDLWIDTLIR